MSGINWSEEDLLARGNRYLEDQRAERDSAERDRLAAARGLHGALAEMPPDARIMTHPVEAKPAKIRKPRAHPEREPGAPKWNKTEARYAQYLDLQKRAGPVMWWVYEGATLKLAPDTRYTPDFMVMVGGDLEFHEVKGEKNGKPRYEDDARVKIACAAEKFRPIRFIIVWPARSGEWDFKEF